MLRLRQDQITPANADILTKAARDNGFELSQPGQWLRFFATDSSAQIILGKFQDGFVFGFSTSAVILSDIEGLQPLLIEPEPELAGFTWRFSEKMGPVYKALKKIHAAGKFSLEKKRFLAEAAQSPDPDDGDPGDVAALSDTEREAIAKLRTVQGKYRSRLLEYWGGKCCITGLSIPELLRASHIKPWKDCNPAERVDVYNGLILSGSLDLAFDQGFISFSDKGEILISSQLPQTLLSVLPLHGNERIDLRSEQIKYLTYHRENVFRGSRAV